MRELSVATTLGLHALHRMVREEKPVRIRDIQASGRFSEADVRSVLGRLQRANLVEGRPGQGYVLARAPGEISVWDVVQAIEKSKAPTAPCGGHYDSCDSRASCVLARLCEQADRSFQETLRSFTLQDWRDVPADLPNCRDSRLLFHPSAGRESDAAGSP